MCFIKLEFTNNSYLEVAKFFQKCLVYNAANSKIVLKLKSQLVVSYLRSNSYDLPKLITNVTKLVA